MLPDTCSIRENDRDCVNPPDKVVSIVSNENEYMIGVVCERHKDLFVKKIEHMKKEAKLPDGKIQFTKLKTVATDCIRTDPDDLFMPDFDKSSNSREIKE